MLKSGDLIGKYQVIRMLGKGGMGEVYAGWDGDLKREVAIKVINSKIRGTENVMRRFRAEAQAIAALSDQHIVHVYDFSPNDENPHIVMEYVNGSTLQHIISNQSPLPVKSVLNYAQQTLKGLMVAHHAGIIHRDIKPANILLSNNGVIKIMDFGLARSLEVESGLTEDGSVVGTIHYLAPEVARGEIATTQSDIYSLGVTIYEMLSGRLPFDEASPLKLISLIARETPPPISTLRSDLSPAVSAWLHNMIANDINNRYKSSEAALRGLSCICSDTADSSRPNYKSGMESTDEIPLVNNPNDSEVKVHSTEATGAEAVRASEIGEIMAEAMKIEKAGRDVLDENSLLEIAAEVGVDAEAVRKAVVTSRKSRQERMRKKLLIKKVSLAAAALILVSLTGWISFRKAPHESREYQLSGGESGGLHTGQAPAARCEPLSVGTGWLDSGLSFNGRTQALLVRGEGNALLECRIEKFKPFVIDGSFYGSPKGSGRVYFRSAAGTATVLAACVKRLRLATLPFSGNGNGQSGLAVGVGDVISTRLAASKCFEIIERVQIDKVIDNLKLENSEFFDPKTAGRIGKVLGVDYLISGVAQEAGERYRLSARRMESETGKVIDDVVVDGAKSELFEIQDRLAERLIDKISQTELDEFLSR